MKKKVLIIVGIIVALLIVAGLITSYVDSARVRNGVEPKYVIKIVSKDGNKVTYWGLGYKVIRYPSVSPNEPYKNKRGAKYGSWFMKYNLKLNNEEVEEVNSEGDDNCNYKAQLLVEQKDRNIYTYCLKNATVKINGKENDLKNFIETDNNGVDKIIDILKLEDTFWDGGTKIYKGDNITLIKCHTLAGNRDVYIGDENMKFKENFCDNDNYTFVRTYTVKSVKEYKKQQYTDDGTPVSYGNSFEVELEQFQAGTKKVIINNLWDIKLEENKTYEFELQLYEDAKNIEDTTEYIFKYSNIIDIRETDKVGMKQLQEPMVEK